MASSPSCTAIKILKVWYDTHTEDERFPVDCRAISNEFHIKVQGGNLGSEFEGALFIENDLKAIIYNENITEEGRKNFTIGHELGHYFLHKDRKELQCSINDLTEFNHKPHPSNIEQEANCFAANLLMPTDDVRRQMKQHRITLDFARILSDRYLTTLTASALRIVEVVHKPAAIVAIRGEKVHWWYRNAAMSQTGFWLTKGQTLPSDCDCGDREGSITNSTTWLDSRRAGDWEITQSVAQMPIYNQTLILLTAESLEGGRDWLDEIDDSAGQRLRW
jgi:Zn-dependent peptidase ImmA (M78 family)